MAIPDYAKGSYGGWPKDTADFDSYASYRVYNYPLLPCDGTLEVARDANGNVHLRLTDQFGETHHLVFSLEAATKLNVLLDAAAPALLWQATTAYSVGAVRILGGSFVEATVAGTSGATAPAEPVAAGDTVVDGTVTWRKVSY